MPAIARFSVRGIGVAVSVSTSTSRRSCFSRSLAATPNRCSSSTTTRPRSLKRDVLADSSRCVPMTTSTLPSREPGDAWRPGPSPETNRDSIRTSSGKAANRWPNVAWCCAREHGRRHEHRDLLAVLRGLERGPQRDLGLAVADVADDEPVHRHGRSMSALTSAVARSWSSVSSYGNDASISDCHGVSRRRPGPSALDARRVQREQLLGELGDGLADPLLGAQPLGAAELAQRRPLAAGVARDPADLLDRHEDPVTAGERQLEVVALLARPAAPQHLLVPRDAMIDVDDEIARRQPFEDVARHDPPQGLRPANADRAEELAVGDEGDAVRAATEPAVQAPADERDRTGRRRLLKSIDHGDAVPGLVEDLGQAGCLVRREDDPGAVLPPGFDRIRQPAGAPERQRRLPPAEQVAGAAGARGHRDVRGRFRLPGQLEGPRRDQAALPVARRQVGRRPVLRQLPGLDQLGSALVRLAPQEPGRLGDIARLVEDEDRSRIEVVEAGRRSEVGGPHLGSVAHRKRPRRIGVRSVGPQRVVGRALEPRQVGREPLGQTGRGPAETVADRGGARRSAGGTPTRGGAPPARPCRSSAGRSDRRRGASRSRRRRTRSGSAAPSTAGTHRRCRRDARTRPCRRPR